MVRAIGVLIRSLGFYKALGRLVRPLRALGSRLTRPWSSQLVRGDVEKTLVT